MANFYCNQTQHPWQPGLMLVPWLQQAGYLDPRLALEHAGIALAINEQIVPRSQWSTRQIVAGDQLELFSVIAGG